MRRQAESPQQIQREQANHAQRRLCDPRIVQRGLLGGPLLVVEDRRRVNVIGQRLPQRRAKQLVCFLEHADPVRMQSKQVPEHIHSLGALSGDQKRHLTIANGFVAVDSGGPQPFRIAQLQNRRLELLAQVSGVRRNDCRAVLVVCLRCRTTPAVKKETVCQLRKIDLGRSLELLVECLERFHEPPPIRRRKEEDLSRACGHVDP